MKSLKWIGCVLVLTSLLLTACGGPKKCGGGRGTKVDMGTM